MGNRLEPTVVRFAMTEHPRRWVVCHATDHAERRSVRVTGVPTGRGGMGPSWRVDLIELDPPLPRFLSAQEATREHKAILAVLQAELEALTGKNIRGLAWSKLA